MDWLSDEYLYMCINDFFENNNITPGMDLIGFCKSKGWDVFKYPEEKFQSCYNQSPDGFSVYENNSFTIMYNPRVNSLGRIRFTIAHEIGHIVLMHHIRLNVGILNNLPTQIDNLMEQHADRFAHNFLMEANITYEFKRKGNLAYLENIFKCSSQMVETRLAKLNKDLVMLKKAKVKCPICGSNIKSTDNYCKYCGHKKLIEKRGVSKVIYNEIEVDKNSKAIKCPICGNENVLEDGEYCQICGTLIINRCTNTDNYLDHQDNCGKLLTGDARYCNYCGSKSTFLENGILQVWPNKDENGFNESVSFFGKEDEDDNYIPF